MNTNLTKLNPPAVQESDATNTPTFYSNRILHIQLWYKDGSEGEINIVSPRHDGGDDTEVQYLYMRMYLRKQAPMFDIVAYQASMIYDDPVRGLRPIGTYDKVDCTNIPPYKPGQTCDERDL